MKMYRRIRPGRAWHIDEGDERYDTGDPWPMPRMKCGVIVVGFDAEVATTEPADSRCARCFGEVRGWQDEAVPQ